ncbi:hypothetical protein A9D46_06805 [Photobacterium damselae subsp. damselae]|uniref:DUF4365 domain-containing protein n=1 Tax=Photobacterium damselae TaxID=38293 RepID=UPI00084B3992|nr:DUF4365 domain-containing protein [Photobacterium damselae]OEC81020.1 hypothetical protein A9D46_06805 [Photobacterium damselae subsp. damselae]
MKVKKTSATAKKGVIQVEDVVNDHGSIFRPVHQEDDIGIDGFIELVENEEATGKLIAVQVKSGESYVAKSGKNFYVPVDKEHLEYWASYLVPVILVCYSPEKKLLCWEVVNEYIRREKYHGREPIKSIKVEFGNVFDIEAISKSLTKVANVGKDRAILIECIDKCLVGSDSDKIAALAVLRSHPDSIDSKTTAFIARYMINDDSNAVAREAVRVLAYHAGRNRWSFNPNNEDEMELIGYASSLCEDLTYEECRRLMDLVEDGAFYGQEALGERVLDIICVVPDVALYMDKIASDANLSMQTRINALYANYSCDEEELLDDKSLLNNPNLSDVYLKIQEIVNS